MGDKSGAIQQANTPGARGTIMKTKLFNSVSDFFGSVSDYVTAADIKREDRRNAELAQQRANIRVAALRERFKAVRELSDRLNTNLDDYKDRRAG
jgi:hypothetical protein